VNNKRIPEKGKVNDGKSNGSSEIKHLPERRENLRQQKRKGI